MLSGLSIFPNRMRLQRGLLFGALIVTALLAFEIFNYSTTDFALTDLLGDLKFIGIRWATILSIAFCGIDFAGIARLFTPEQGRDEPAEVWYLFGAWMLAALMNAMLTWWGVSIAILNHQTLGNAVVARATLLKVVPIFVAIMVWLIRVLIIGTISIAGDRIFSQSNMRTSQRSTKKSATRKSSSNRPQQWNNNRRSTTTTQGVRARSFSPAPKQTYSDGDFASQEPTYHPVSFADTGKSNGNRSPNNTPRF
ncbi:MAG: hypothetical protein HN413_10995 [Chloroflexi bacterium]|jgi:hypothetical protein|nr:hypothetical protein [Chloroflexota bacterium]